MCNQSANAVIESKFGYQRANYYTGLSEKIKSLSTFDKAVYFPTNWRVYDPQKAKFPQFIKYGGFVPVIPEYFRKNYLGVYSLKQQPVIDEPEAHTIPRYS